MISIELRRSPGLGRAQANIGYVQPRGSNFGYSYQSLLRTLRERRALQEKYGRQDISRIPPQPVIRKTPQQLREERLQRWSAFMHSQTPKARAETETKVQQVITRRLPANVQPLPTEAPKITYRYGRKYKEMPGGGYVRSVSSYERRSQPAAPARMIVQRYIPTSTSSFRQRAQLIRQR